jgi:hypothetical protein
MATKFPEDSVTASTARIDTPVVEHTLNEALKDTRIDSLIASAADLGKRLDDECVEVSPRTQA